MAFLDTIGATAYGITSIGTPLALVMKRCFGARKTVFIGVSAISLGTALTGTVDHPEEMFMTYGIMVGCGTLLANNPPWFLLSEYFTKDHKYYVLTSSLPTLSFSLGSLIFNPCTQALIHSIGWRNTYAFISILTFVVGMSAMATFRENGEPKVAQQEAPSSGDGQSSNEDDSNSGAVEPLANPPIWLVLVSGSVYVLSMGLRSMALFTPVFILVKHLQNLGVASMSAAAVVTIYSTADLCGRLFTSLLGDKLFKGRIMYVNIVCSVLLGLENFAAGFAVQYYQMVIFALVAGFTAGLMSAGIFASSSEVLDGWYAHEIFSFSRVGNGIGVIVGLGLSGFIYDLTGSYHLVYHLNLGVFLLAGTGYGITILLRNRKLRNRSTDNSEHIPLNSSK
ncbi:monocarboxylate transporter 10 [Lingula anatina]|uniref:Monocarboxylate transporter 10 n=1 Tax=Lingula anatina TaxID=7574 RepID=A0A1S3JD83_LINAN|nr:monocarboxylate transporter 10 [Lingula anatina]|eukprot:XP_013408375.1 monocarboxylate transporter 10 [Lingula anatina]